MPKVTYHNGWIQPQLPLTGDAPDSDREMSRCILCAVERGERLDSVVDQLAGLSVDGQIQTAGRLIEFDDSIADRLLISSRGVSLSTSRYPLNESIKKQGS